MMFYDTAADAFRDALTQVAIVTGTGLPMIRCEQLAAHVPPRDVDLAGVGDRSDALVEDSAPYRRGRKPLFPRMGKDRLFQERV
jgi:hypothetical protein